MPDPQLKSLGLSPELHAYLVAHGTPPDAVQRELIAETAQLGPIAVMQVAPEQGAFLTLIARLIGAREAVEVGTFTGYSSLAIARGLAPGGSLLCCDVSTEWTAIARRAWERAGVADRIELKIAPAAETLRALPEAPRFDLAFIDADKENYAVYYEEILKRTRMIVDDKELQLKSRENRILDLERKRNACTTNKEYQSLMEQIAADRQANSVLSDEIIELLDKREATATAVKDAEARLVAIKQDLEKVRARVDEERVPLDAELHAMEERLRTAELIIGPEIREPYQRNVKKHAEEALAAIEDGDICGGCYQTITSQMIHELRLSRGIIFCKSCGRVLYLPG